MWFNILKLDLSNLQPDLETADADADAINIQKPNKCKETLLKIIEIMKDADKKARQAFPNMVEEVANKSQYKNKDGETIKFYILDWAGDDKLFSENTPYRFGFSVRSNFRNADNFKEIDETLACQLLEALREVMASFDEPVSEERKIIRNSEGRQLGIAKYIFVTEDYTYIRNSLSIYDTSRGFDVVSIGYGASGKPTSYETFEGHREFEKELLKKLYAAVYKSAFTKIKGML